jgi:hypothetical protein
MTLDNKPPVVNLTTPAVNECGVIPWSTVPPLNFDVSAVQENGRLHSWGLYYTKGSDPTLKYLNPTPPSDPWSNTSKNGVPGSINGSVPGASMLNGLTGTCAFALKLWAWAHVRNGRWFIFYVEQMKAIVIEKCK